MDDLSPREDRRSFDSASAPCKIGSGKVGGRCAQDDKSNSGALTASRANRDRSLRLAFDRQFSRRRDGVDGLGDIHQREAQLLPLMKSAQQRTHVADTVFAEFQRHPGAGRFVWSSTEEDDLAVAGDLAVARLQVLR